MLLAKLSEVQISSIVPSKLTSFPPWTEMSPKNSLCQNTSQQMSSLGNLLSVCCAYFWHSEILQAIPLATRADGCALSSIIMSDFYELVNELGRKLLIVSGPEILRTYHLFYMP